MRVEFWCEAEGKRWAGVTFPNEEGAQDPPVLYLAEERIDGEGRAYWASDFPHDYRDLHARVRVPLSDARSASAPAVADLFRSCAAELQRLRARLAAHDKPGGAA